MHSTAVVVPSSNSAAEVSLPDDHPDKDAVVELEVAGPISTSCGISEIQPESAPTQAVTKAVVGREVAVHITNTSITSRRITAALKVEAPRQVVWAALTDYDDLGSFIPGLVENRCLERSPTGCKLYQKSAQEIALGMKFSAGVTLDIQEYPAGLPAHLCAEEGVHDYSRAFPCPNNFTLQRQSYSDISFALLEGDFAAFKGIWRLQSASEDSGPMQLSYAVYVRPMPWLPVSLIQHRIEKEIRANLQAVRQYAEGQHQRQIAGAQIGSMRISISSGSSSGSLSSLLDEEGE